MANNTGRRLAGIADGLDSCRLFTAIYVVSGLIGIFCYLVYLLVTAKSPSECAAASAVLEAHAKERQLACACVLGGNYTVDCIGGNQLTMSCAGSNRTNAMMMATACMCYYDRVLTLDGQPIHSCDSHQSKVNATGAMMAALAGWHLGLWFCSKALRATERRLQRGAVADDGAPPSSPAANGGMQLAAPEGGA